MPRAAIRAWCESLCKPRADGSWIARTPAAFEDDVYDAFVLPTDVHKADYVRRCVAFCRAGVLQHAITWLGGMSVCVLSIVTVLIMGERIPGWQRWFAIATLVAFLLARLWRWSLARGLATMLQPLQPIGLSREQVIWMRLDAARGVSKLNYASASPIWVKAGLLVAFGTLVLSWAIYVYGVVALCSGLVSAPEMPSRGISFAGIQRTCQSSVPWAEPVGISLGCAVIASCFVQTVRKMREA